MAYRSLLAMNATAIDGWSTLWWRFWSRPGGLELVSAYPEHWQAFIPVPLGQTAGVALYSRFRLGCALDEPVIANVVL